MNKVSIIGAGLAGCEAALQLASHGFDVSLYDSKPQKLLETYKLPTYAELVCNNSMGSNNCHTPLGLLLQELKSLGSIMISIAEECLVNDPTFFAVDKIAFSNAVTSEMNHSNIKIINMHISEIPKDDYVIISTGPLTDKILISNLAQKYNIEDYHFSDASSPVVDICTVDITNKNVKRISEDLFAISIPISSFRLFYDELIKQAKKITFHDVDKAIFFEKCQSIEQIALLGQDELYLKRFNFDYFNTPTLLLRRETALKNGFLLVGCTTALRQSSQLSVFSKLPGLERCRFIKYGRMHRNTFFNAPKLLNEYFQLRTFANTFIIGQLSGVDGYTSAIASGFISAMRIIYGDLLPKLPQCTMIGGLTQYISNSNNIDFQPMCASFSLMDCQNNFWDDSACAIQAYSNYIKSL